MPRRLTWFHLVMKGLSDKEGVRGVGLYSLEIRRKRESHWSSLWDRLTGKMLRMFPWGQSLRIGIVHLGQKCGDNFFIQRNCVVSSYFVCYLEGDWITSSLKMKILKVVQLGFHSILISLPLTFFYIEKKFYFLWLCSPMLQPIVQFPPVL